MVSARQPSTGWQPPFCMRSSSSTLVELVVADAVVVELHEVERLDRRLVVERRRQQRRRADQVARRDEQRVRVLGAQRADVSRQVLDAAGVRRPIRPPEPVGGSRLPWKSFQTQYLDLGRLRPSPPPAARGRRRAFADATPPATASACSAALAEGPASAAVAVPGSGDVRLCRRVLGEAAITFAGGPPFAAASGAAAIATASAAIATNVLCMCLLFPL